MISIFTLNLALVTNYSIFFHSYLIKANKLIFLHSSIKINLGFRLNKGPFPLRAWKKTFFVSFIDLRLKRAVKIEASAKKKQ